jgi:hypothetical protein
MKSSIHKKSLLIGFILGILSATSSAVFAVKVLGNGYLMGWEVTYKGRTICDDPYIWSGTREIECD